MNTTIIRPYSYPRTRHMKGSPGATPDDIITTDNDWIIPFLNREIILSEKLDGENTSITNQSVYARSKYPSINPWSVNIRELFPYVKDYISDDEIVFGENLYAIHSIEYNNLPSYFHIFAVFNTKENIWYSWDDVVDFAGVLDLPTVPVLFRGTISSEKELMDMINSFMSKPSTYGIEKEGVVMRLASEIKPEDWNNSVAKWVRANHVRTNKRWEDHWKEAVININ